MGFCIFVVFWAWLLVENFFFFGYGFVGFVSVESGEGDVFFGSSRKYWGIRKGC